MARKAGATAIGREACKRAARRGALHALLMASDAGRSAARDCGWRAPVPLLDSGLDKRGLGALVGRDALAALGITEPHLAAGLVRVAPRVEGRDTGDARAAHDASEGGERT